MVLITGVLVVQKNCPQTWRLLTWALLAVLLTILLTSQRLLRKDQKVESRRVANALIKKGMSEKICRIVFGMTSAKSMKQGSGNLRQSSNIFLKKIWTKSCSSLRHFSTRWGWKELMLLPVSSQSSLFSKKKRCDWKQIERGGKRSFFVVAGSLMIAPGFKITTILPLYLVLVV